MGLDAGKFTLKINVDKPQTAKTPSGQPVDAWVPHKQNVWSQPKTASGMASMAQTGTEQGVKMSNVGYSFRIRFDDSYTSDMRVRAQMPFMTKEMVFAIRQVRHDLERFEWTDLVCEQGNG